MTAVVRVLAVADEVDEILRSDARAAQGTELIVSCDDLPDTPPWPPGAINADGRIVDVAGLRRAGLGGSPRYRGGPNQYTDRQQARRARGLRRNVVGRHVFDVELSGAT